METEFEPAVRTVETPEARIIIVSLPGFRTEDLRVQVNGRGNLIISGERRATEMEETTRVGGRMEKMHGGGHKFRKVISVPENVDLDKITAKVKDQELRVNLPFVQKDQKSDVSVGGKPQTADTKKPSKPDERSSPVRKEGLMQERPAAAQNNQSARLPEVTRPDDYKEKASAAAEEAKAKASAAAEEAKAKAIAAAKEAKAKASAAAEEAKAKVGKYAQDFVHGEPPTQAVSAQTGSDPDQSGPIQSISKQRKKDDESCLPSPNVQFPERRFQIPSFSRRSMFSNSSALVASIVLVLCAGMFLSYILRPRQAGRNPSRGA